MQLLQVGQRALPRAEIVQRPLHAKLAQLLDVVLQLRIVRQRLALGDFQDQLRAFAADGAEQTPHVVDEPMLAKCEPLTLTPR